MSAPAGAFLLHLVRETATDKATCGKLFVDGVWKWWTLEDPLAYWHGGVKVPERTGIPAGTYRVRMTMSQRFGKIMPALVGVPQFSGIRIHAGNTVDDTQGCILVGGGLSVKSARLLHSRMARDEVYADIARAEKAGKEVWIEIIDPPERRH